VIAEAPQSCLRGDVRAHPQPYPAFVTDTPRLSRHVTDNVTDDLEKNLGKTDLVTMSRLKRGVPPTLPSLALLVLVTAIGSAFPPSGPNY
jgi:hypothetical protein